MCFLTEIKNFKSLDLLLEDTSHYKNLKAKMIWLIEKEKKVSSVHCFSVLLLNKIFFSFYFLRKLYSTLILVYVYIYLIKGVKMESPNTIHSISLLFSPWAIYFWWNFFHPKFQTIKIEENLAHLTRVWTTTFPWGWIWEK